MKAALTSARGGSTESDTKATYQDMMANSLMSAFDMTDDTMTVSLDDNSAFQIKIPFIASAQGYADAAIVQESFASSDAMSVISTTFGEDLVVSGDPVVSVERKSLPPLPPAVPLPTIPPLPPFTPLGAGEAIEEVLSTITQLEFTVAGDVSSLDRSALVAALTTELKCVAPCQLEVSVSAGSVAVTTKMTVPAAETAKVAEVAAAASAMVAKPIASLGTALGVTVESISPTVSSTTQLVALKVAPPPPPPVSSGGMGAGAIAGIVLGVLCAIGIVAGAKVMMDRRKKKNAVKVSSVA